MQLILIINKDINWYTYKYHNKQYYCKKPFKARTCVLFSWLYVHKKDRSSCPGRTVCSRPGGYRERRRRWPPCLYTLYTGHVHAALDTVPPHSSLVLKHLLEKTVSIATQLFLQKHWQDDPQIKVFSELMSSPDSCKFKNQFDNKDNFYF